jgi:hypothetical protein
LNKLLAIAAGTAKTNKRTRGTGGLQNAPESSIAKLRVKLYWPWQMMHHANIIWKRSLQP